LKALLSSFKELSKKKKRGGRGEGRERENGKRGRPGEPRAACEKEIMRVSLSFEHKFGQNKKTNSGTGRPKISLSFGQFEAHSGSPLGEMDLAI